jgi:hypothetical protein
LGNSELRSRVKPVPDIGYTYGSMTRRKVFRDVAEWLLCVWVIGAQLWYLAQFRPLVEFAVRKVLHRG